MDEQDARAQIVEAMAKALADLNYELGSIHRPLEKVYPSVAARVALDAALALRTEEPCPECKEWLSRPRSECSRCHGALTVPSEPVLVPRWRMEPYGYAVEEDEWIAHMLGPGARPYWFVATNRPYPNENKYTVPVYRIRDESETEVLRGVGNGGEPGSNRPTSPRGTVATPDTPPADESETE